MALCIESLQVNLFQVSSYKNVIQFYYCYGVNANSLLNVYAYPSCIGTFSFIGAISIIFSVNIVLIE